MQLGRITLEVNTDGQPKKLRTELWSSSHLEAGSVRWIHCNSQTKKAQGARRTTKRDVLEKKRQREITPFSLHSHAGRGHDGLHFTDAETGLTRVKGHVEDCQAEGGSCLV